MYIRSFFRKFTVKLTVSVIAKFSNEVYFVDLIKTFTQSWLFLVFEEGMDWDGTSLA